MSEYCSIFAGTFFRVSSCWTVGGPSATIAAMETSRIASSLLPDDADTPVARIVRERVVASRERFWRSEEFAGSRRAVEHALSRLVADDELVHVRRGLYWRGRRTSFGWSRPSPRDVAVAIAGGDGVGPAGWSATNALGIATQVPGVETVAVPSRAPSPVSGVRWVSRAARWARRAEKLTPVEVALLEALEGFEGYVDIPHEEAVRRLIALVGSGDVRPDRLVRASITEPARTRRRLRDLLVHADFAAVAGRIPPAPTAAPIHALAA